MGRAWIIALAGVLACQAARAADCGPLRQINSIPVTLKGSRILLPVKINGTPETFMLDTGGAFSQIAPSVARELKLPISDVPRKLIDMYGNASNTAASAAFALGQMEDKSATLQVATRDFAERQPFAGILAADYMGSYDTELDLAGGKLNYFSPDHCPGRVVYWRAGAVAEVPVVFRNNHIQVSVTLNGKPVSAILDTGAPVSVLRAEAAKRLFDITGDSPGNRDAGMVDGKKQFVRVFDTLDFEGIAVSHPPVLIMPDLVGAHDANNGYVTGTRVQRVDDLPAAAPPLVIGMDVISKLHLYIAFKEGKMYVTPPTPPAALPARGKPD